MVNNNAMKTRIILIHILILLFGFGAYIGVLDNQFQTWDTQSFVLNNPYLTALTWENIGWMFSFSTEFGGLWHPLSWLSLSLDHALYGGFDAWGFHLSNLVLHLCNSLLVFWLFYRYLTLQKLNLLSANCWQFLSVKQRKEANSELNIYSSALAALWFVLHPQHVESVAWVIERKDVLSLFFALLSLIHYLNYIDPKNSQTKRSYWLSLVFFSLALLSKPMMISLPLILLLFDAYPRAPQLGFSWQQLKGYLWEKLPFFCLSGLVALLTLIMQSQTGAVSNLGSLPLDMRLINALNNVFFYLSKMLIPLGLVPLYSFEKYIEYNALTQLWLPLFGFLATSFLAAWQWSRRPYLLSAWLFYLITLLPVIGLIQVGYQTAADRYSYLPTLPFYLLLAVGFISLLNNKKMSLILGLVIALGLAGLTRSQLLIWHDDLSLWQYTTRNNPNDVFAQHNLAAAYFNLGAYREAAGHYQISVDLAPDPVSYFQLGIISLYFDKDASAALNYYQQALQGFAPNHPHRVQVYNQMALAYAQLGQCIDAQSMLDQAKTTPLKILQQVKVSCPK